MASAFELLRRLRAAPVAAALGEREQLQAAGAAWGKPARRWLEPGDSAALEGGEMPSELRALAAASFAVFSRVQRVGGELATAEVLRASREYREALTTCIFALEDGLEQAQSADEEMKHADGDAEEEERFVDLLKVSLAVWHLCELLLLQRGAWNDRHVAYELARWLQQHYAGEFVERAESEFLRLKRTEQPEQDPAFWQTVRALVIAGSGSSAWSLLATHSSYKSLFSRDVGSLTGTSMRASFQAIQRVLELMPGRARHPDIAMLDGEATADEWRSWRAECERLLTSDSYIKSHDELTQLLQVLVADEAALRANVSSWFELMMARLYLEEPKRVAHRFEFLMANCFQALGAEMGNFDYIVLAILQYDVQSALQDIFSMGLSWMAAHLTDLLEKSGVVANDVMPESECSLRERFLLEYALELSATSGMWQFVVGYAETCQQFGSIVITSTIDREPVPTDRKANALLNYCQGKGLLVKTQRFIAVRRATESQQIKAYGAALMWLLRAQHLDDVDELCDIILEECESTGSLTPLNEAVEFLEGSDVRQSLPLKLEWLVRYREFSLVLEDRRYLSVELDKLDAVDGASVSDEEYASVERKYRFVSCEAAKRLHLLLSSDGAPRSLRAHLLEEAEVLLEMSPSVFEPQHLYSLMAYIRAIDRSFDSTEMFSPQSSASALKSRVEQLALRNLSESLLAIPTHSESLSADAFRDGVNSSAFVGPHYVTTAAASLTSPMED